MRCVPVIQNKVRQKQKKYAKGPAETPQYRQMYQNVNPRGPGNFLMKMNTHSPLLQEKSKAEMDFRCKRGGNHQFLNETQKFSYEIFSRF